MWTIGTLNNGAIATITLTGTVDAGEGGNTITNVTTAATGDQTDPSTAGDDLTETVTVITADLVTVKSIVGSNTPAEGESVTFQIDVRNDGLAQATNVSLIDSLPAGISLTGGTISQGSYDPDTGIFDIGTLNVGETATITLTGTVDAGQGGNTITNVTTAATGDQTDPTTVGDDLEESVTVDNPVVPPLLGSIGNLVFEDLNNNGIRDAGDPGEPGVTIELLDGNGNPILDASGNPITTVTDANGFYEFTDLPAGDYRVRSSLPAAHFFTAQDAGNDDTIDSDVDSTGLSSVVTLGEGENNPTVDVGIAHFASLNARVFFDTNGDGVQDAGDPGVANVVVNLLDGNGNPILDDAGVAVSTTTDANGNYSFDQLQPGDFQVQFVAPTGTDFTLQNVGDDALDSDADPTTGLSQVFSLVSEENNTTIDAGLVNEPVAPPALGSIGNLVFEDLNNNGIRDAGDPGEPGVTIELLDGDGNAILDASGNPITTVTDANGFYEFTDLPAGDYRVRSSLPAAHFFTAQDAGNDDTIDSDVDSTGLSSVVTLGEGENNPTVDVGIAHFAALGDTVFFDNNGDGVQDAGEAGVANVVVNLLDGNGNPIFDDAGVAVSTTTDANGNYAFDELKPGDFQVQFVAPTGTDFTLQNVGNDALDSDADPTTGLSQVVSLVSEENNTTIDAGLINNEADLVTVKTLASGNSTPAEGDIVTFEITVTNNGSGTATSVFLTDFLPDGLMATEGNGIVSQGSYDPATGIFGIGTLQVGESATLFLEGTVDAGQGGNTITNTTTAATGDQIDPSTAGDDLTESVDVDNTADLITIKSLSSGDNNPAEGDIVTFIIDVFNNGSATATNVSLTDFLPAGLTATAENGVVTRGSYDPATGVFSVGTLGVGESVTLFLQGTVDAGQGGNTITNTTTAATGDQFDPTTANDDLTESVDVDSQIQLGSSSISGTVFQDDNGNGIQDAGEVGIEGVTVTLTGTDDFGNPVELTVLTDANGNYSFENLNSGTYTVTQTQPAGFDDGNDNGAPGSTVGNDQISNITLGTGEAVAGNTFGETLALDAPLNEGTAGFPPNLPSFATFDNLSIGNRLGFNGSPGPIYAGIPINANANPLSLESGRPIAGGYNVDFGNAESGAPVEVEQECCDAAPVDPCNTCGLPIPVMQQPVEQIIGDQCGCGPVMSAEPMQSGEVINEGQIMEVPAEIEPGTIPNADSMGTPLGLTAPSFLKRFTGWLSNTNQI